MKGGRLKLTKTHLVLTMTIFGLGVSSSALSSPGCNLPPDQVGSGYQATSRTSAESRCAGGSYEGSWSNFDCDGMPFDC